MVVERCVVELATVLAVYDTLLMCSYVSCGKIRIIPSASAAQTGLCVYGHYAPASSARCLSIST